VGGVESLWLPNDLHYPWLENGSLGIAITKKGYSVSTSVLNTSVLKTNFSNLLNLKEGLGVN